MKQTIEEALLEHEQRMNATLEGLKRIIYQTILYAKSLVQEEGHAVNANTCVVGPQSNNTEIITAIFINIDPAAAGTFNLVLGRLILTNITVPSGGLLVLDQQNIVLRPNDKRQLVTSAANPAFINMYLHGREVGEFGGIA